jgi:hypothetical protein
VDAVPVDLDNDDFTSGNEDDELNDGDQNAVDNDLSLEHYYHDTFYLVPHNPVIT